MRRSVVLAAMGIATLGISSFAIIATVSRDTADERAGRVGAVSSSSLRDRHAPMEASTQAAVGSTPTDGAVAASASPTVAPAVAASQPDPWASVVPVDRAEELGEVGPAFAAALSESFGAMGRCFEEATTAKDEASTAVRESAAGEQRGPPILLLELETTAGGARIVDAPVGVRGAAGDDVIRCAQSVFRDMRIDVPGALPGKRYRMRYALVQ